MKCQKQVPYDFTYMWNLISKTNEKIKHNETDRYREQTGGCQREKGVGVRQNGSRGSRDTDFQLYSK